MTMQAMIEDLQERIRHMRESLDEVESLLLKCGEMEDAKQANEESKSPDAYGKFQNLLKERGVTAYRVAQETGIAASTLSDWKNGLYTPKVDKLVLLAKYFDVPVNYFIDGGRR